MAKHLSETERAKADRIREFLKTCGESGRIFSVTFVKRTNGETRTLVGRLGVKKHLKGGEKSFKDEDVGLLTVFDVQKGQYRSIALESVTHIRSAGESISEPVLEFTATNG